MEQPSQHVPAGDSKPAMASATPTTDNDTASRSESRDNRDNRKRKRDDHRRGGKALQHGSRGNKRKNLGRNEHFREQLDRRGRNLADQDKRKAAGESSETPASTLPPAFPKEELDAEERRPKRKVAVMIGYSGTGYKGMQIDPKQKTIEGDLFAAFVAAGAISKANADDPKKSSLVRCARTDKGVHAAGNIISLKLIIEDEDIVEKINSNLSPQIRVWGIQRTTGSFSCYQACDSRWYEYLIPTHSFLPPHPSSFMGKKLEELAEKAGDLEEYRKRQEDVAHFWPEVEEKHIKPIIDSLDDSIRPLVEQVLYTVDSTNIAWDPVVAAAADIPQGSKPKESEKKIVPTNGAKAEAQESEMKDSTEGSASISPPSHTDDQGSANATETETTDQQVEAAVDAIQQDNKDIVMNDTTDGSIPLPDSVVDKAALEAAIRTLKKAYMDAKKAYRISEVRKNRVQEALNLYVGTRNYHNYTVQKKFKDASAKRHIKSFKVADKPIIINDTEWLSLKVHGQSFMMHQIRKMVGMAALAVRCGTNLDIIKASFENVTVRIPKAPGLGLLLERPVFDSYNQKVGQHGREKIDFDKFEKEILEFKQREIYERIFREEAQGNQFNTFFTHLDNYKDPTFLYLTSGGIAATRELGKKTIQEKWEDSEEENASGGEG